MAIGVLTSRESEIIQLISQGYSNQQMAEKLNISKYTIDSHTSNIYRKLQVKNRSHALGVIFSLND